MLRRFAFAFVVLGFASGCGGSYAHHHHASHPHGGGGGAVVVAAGVGLLAGIAIASSSHSHPPEERVVERVVYVESPPPSVVVVMPPPRDRERTSAPELPPFPAPEARAALGDVDLSPCRDVGAPRGHGHAQVTFNPDGAVSKVVVDTPDGLQAAAVQCIGNRLGAVKVAEYKGSLVTVGTSWFVP